MNEEKISYKKLLLTDRKKIILENLSNIGNTVKHLKNQDLIDFLNLFYISEVKND